MTKNRILLTFTLLCLLTECGQKKDDSVPMVSTISTTKTKELIRTGDIGAYNQLSREYFDSPNDDSFLTYALLMANKYNYGPAYADVYYCLTDMFHKADNKELDDLDEKTRQLAIKYLIDGAEIGNYDCQQILGQLYIDGKYLEQDTTKGKQLLQELE